jgi:hypothetical protein
VLVVPPLLGGLAPTVAAVNVLARIAVSVPSARQYSRLGWRVLKWEGPSSWGGGNKFFFTFGIRLSLTSRTPPVPFLRVAKVFSPPDPYKTGPRVPTLLLNVSPANTKQPRPCEYRIWV